MVAVLYAGIFGANRRDAYQGLQGLNHPRPQIIDGGEQATIVVVGQR